MKNDWAGNIFFQEREKHLGFFYFFSFAVISVHSASQLVSHFDRDMAQSQGEGGATSAFATEIK